MITTVWVEAADGVRAAARYCGPANAPALFFIHGVGSTAAIWDAQLRGFEETHRCFAIELRGNGVAQPDPPPETITRMGFVQDVLAIADLAKVDRFHVIGCSLGGVVGFELWRWVPERIASLTFVGSYASYPDAHAYVAGVSSAVEAAGDMATFAAQRATRLGLPEHRLSETIEQMARKSVPSYLAATHATWTGDYHADLASISVPALVVCGERDAVAPLALSQEIANGIPDARLVVLKGAGHVSNADEPDAFNALLRTFLSEVMH